MIRNLKTLGVALAAVFALSAAVASAASAQQAYLTADGPLGATKGLTGEDTGEAKLNRLTALGTFTHCNNATYDGSLVAGIDSAHGSTFKLEPTYANCISTILNLTTHVAMNGCYYLLHLKETTKSPPADTYGVTSTLICDKGKDPVVTITQGANICTITITHEKASDFDGLDITDNTTGDLLLKGTATGIFVDATGAACPKTGTNLDASLDVNITVVGDDTSEHLTNIGISELGETTSSI